MLMLVVTSKLSAIEQFSKSNGANAGRDACTLHEKEQDAVRIAHSSLTDEPLAGGVHVAVLSSKLKSLPIPFMPHHRQRGRSRFYIVFSRVNRVPRS